MLGLQGCIFCIGFAFVSRLFSLYYRLVMDVQTENFVCQRCGACCRVPGYVRLTDADVDALAADLALSVEAFIEAYTELSPTRSGLVLKGDTMAPCQFLTEDNLCRVHRARPQQCRDYPERWRSEDIEAVCAAERARRLEK